MNKKFLGVGLTLITLFLLYAYLRMDSSTPPGQEPLATLTPANFSAFESAFDNSNDGPRLVLLLSPT